MPLTVGVNLLKNSFLDVNQSELDAFKLINSIFSRALEITISRTNFLLVTFY